MAILPTWGRLTMTKMMRSVIVILQIHRSGCERSNQTYQCHCRRILSISQQRRGTLFPIITAWGGVGGDVVSGGGRARGKGNVREEDAEEDNDGFSSSGGGKR